MKALAFAFSLLLIAPLSFANADETKANQDPEIVAALVVLNNNEISAADLALSKSANKDVKKYAKFMKKAHSKNLTETMDIAKKQNITPVDDQKATDLKTHGQQEASDLNKLTTTDFDKAYMNDMVMDHQAALTMLDECIKEVSNPQLKAQLKATRTHVQRHLDAAKKVQSKLG